VTRVAVGNGRLLIDCCAVTVAADDTHMHAPQRRLHSYGHVSASLSSNLTGVLPVSGCATTSGAQHNQLHLAYLAASSKVRLLDQH
jgi:hypothetical protein